MIDASANVAGKVLMQDHGDSLYPVAFMGGALKPSEQKYPAFGRELATIRSYFCYDLFGESCEVILFVKQVHLLGHGCATKLENYLLFHSCTLFFIENSFIYVWL